MAATCKLYSNFPHLLLEDKLGGSILDQTIKVALVTSSYTFDQEAHDYFDDITNEVSGTGYTAGGATLTSKSCTMSSRVTTFDADDVTWTSSTITARGAVIYCDTGTASTSLLIAYLDFGEDKSSTSGDFKIEWGANGIFTITVAA